MPSHYEMARAPHRPATAHINMPSGTPKHMYPTLSSSTAGVASSDVKAFDVEAAMANSIIDPSPDARPRHFRSLFQECIFVFTVMMSTASTTFIQGSVIINTATIGRDLIMTPAQITWIAAAIGLGSGSFMLFFGKTADLFGRKVQLLGGMTFLSLVSLVISFSPNPMAVNVLCGFLGLGTAVIAPPSIGILMSVYPEGRRRNKAMGALGSGNPLGSILGSVSSGVATKYFSWRASFIIISIFFFVMTIVSIWTVPMVRRAGNTRTLIKQFDYLGTALTITGMAFVSSALTEGPERGWNNPRTILLLIFGGLCLCGFGFWERICKHPLLDPIVWKNKNFSLCVLIVLFGFMSFTTNQFWISLYMQDVQQLAPLHIAARMMPQAFAGIIWSYLGQALMSRISGRTIMGIGALAYLTGATLLIFIRKDTSYWKLLFPALCITVIGADFQFIVSNLYISKQMPAQASLAAGVLQTAMRLSLSLGLSITAAVYGSVAQTPQGRADVTFPFERAYLCSMLFALASLFLVPFLKIGNQGQRSPRSSMEEQVESIRTIVEEERSGSGDKYYEYLSDGRRRTIGYKPSETSLWSAATMGSVNSFFPRWSWETDKEKSWPGDRYLERENVVYEVCIKCLEERRVVLQDGNQRASSRGSGIGARDSVLAMINNYYGTYDFGDQDVEEAGNEWHDPNTDKHTGVDVYDNLRLLGHEKFSPTLATPAQSNRYPLRSSEANRPAQNVLHGDPMRFENYLSTTNWTSTVQPGRRPVYDPPVNPLMEIYRGPDRSSANNLSSNNYGAEVQSHGYLPDDTETDRYWDQTDPAAAQGYSSYSSRRLRAYQPQRGYRSLNTNPFRQNRHHTTDGNFTRGPRQNTNSVIESGEGWL